MASPLTIGKLAKSASVNVETIRYYERRGLIVQPPKPKQGYRVYSSTTLHRLLFIKRAQELGFTLDEVANLLRLGDDHCQAVQTLAEHKLSTIQSKIADLQRLETVLSNLVTQCQTNQDQTHCPIVESLVPSQKNNTTDST